MPVALVARSRLISEVDFGWLPVLAVPVAIPGRVVRAVSVAVGVSVAARDGSLLRDTDEVLA